MTSVEKVEIVSPPAYLANTADTNEKRNNAKYIVAGVVAVVVIAMVIGAVLGGIYLQNKSTHQLVKEFAVTSKDKDGRDQTDNVKVDTKKNEEESTSQDGKLKVLQDYNRGIVVIRTRMNKDLACFLKPLNKTGVTEPKALKDYLETVETKNEVKSEQDNVVYKPASDPVEDTSFLSAHAQEMCKGLDTFWLLPTDPKDRTTRAICYRYYRVIRFRCRRIGGRWICRWWIYIFRIRC